MSVRRPRNTIDGLVMFANTVPCTFVDIPNLDTSSGRLIASSRHHLFASRTPGERIEYQWNPLIDDLSGSSDLFPKENFPIGATGNELASGCPVNTGHGSVVTL